MSEFEVGVACGRCGGEIHAQWRVMTTDGEDRWPVHGFLEDLDEALRLLSIQRSHHPKTSFWIEERWVSDWRVRDEGAIR